VPDIAMITNTGVFKKTRSSLDRYVEEEQIILHTNKGVDWSNGERLAEHRLQVVKETKSDWVFLLDHDDELVRSPLVISQLKTFDYVLFPFYDTNGRIRTAGTCSSQRAFGFHMIIAQREAAIAALKYVQEGRFYRDDTAYLIWLIENCRGAQMSQILVRKSRDHLPIEVPELRETMKQECREIWRNRLFRIRQNILPGMLQI
jgi:hypothetical protein